MNRIVAIFLITTILLTGCAAPSENAVRVSVSDSSLYVSKVENLPEDFIMGMDASCVPALEAGGVKYYKSMPAFWRGKSDSAHPTDPQ